MMSVFLTTYQGAILGPIARLLGYILQGLYSVLSVVGIENTGILQHADPRERAEQEAHAHGQHDEHLQKPLRERLALGDEVGHRIADHQADERGEQAQPDRAQEDRQIRAHPGQIGQRELTGDRIGQRVVEDDAKRDDRKQDHPDDIRAGEQLVILHRLLPPRRRQSRHIPRCRRSSRRRGRSTRSCA